MTAVLLTDQMITTIWKKGLDRLPSEAVGIITPDSQILELPNRSLSPDIAFQFNVSDIAVVLDLHHIWLTDEEWKNLTIWHTHPSGGVGPSRTDMRAKVPPLGHLVVALTDSGPVPTWY